VRDFQGGLEILGCLRLGACSSGTIQSRQSSQLPNHCGFVNVITGSVEPWRTRSVRLHLASPALNQLTFHLVDETDDYIASPCFQISSSLNVSEILTQTLTLKSRFAAK
jgi:hypothetical protein